MTCKIKKQKKGPYRVTLIVEEIIEKTEEYTKTKSDTYRFDASEIIFSNDEVSITYPWVK